MKHTRVKKKSNRSIASILFLGLFVLTACASICLIHVVDVQSSFERVKTLETYKSVQDATHILADKAAKTLDVLNQAAVMMTTDKKRLTEEDIFQTLQRYSSLEEFEHVYYALDDGTLYGDNGVVDKLEDSEYKTAIQTPKSVVRISFERKSDSGAGIIYYTSPVILDGKQQGQLVATHNLIGNLSTSSFDNLMGAGGIFLVNSKGDIFARESDALAWENMDYYNLIDCMRENAADSTSKTKVSRLKSKISKSQYVKTSLVDKNGMTDYVEVRLVPGVEQLYFAFIYPETIYTNDIRPVISRTLLICIIMMGITIGMYVYVWATSKKANDMIAALAYDDPITNGKNDNYFREVAANVIWENTSIPFLVVRFDVANFRYINEAYGHLRADELLRIIIEESQKVFRGKEICTRMNADQFVLLARNDPEFEAKCEEMIAVINDRAREIGIMFPIRLKRGIYPVRRDDIDISIIIDRANAARKSLTGDEKVLVATYSDKIVKQMYKVDKIESEMEAAMHNGEFKIYIQPKWDIVHDCIYGGEALVRWIKEGGSVVYPDEFIPVFEKNGFVEKLDLYMLEEVCKRLRQLIDQGKNIFPISVNQSRILLHNPEYVNQVARILKSYRIPNGYIELEITETVFLDERNLMIRTMNKLKKLEVQLSMDDFGSGYSSLNMLKDVPFDVMKIDREFFSESITTNSSILILRKIVEMAEGLGIRVLCEGVETAEQVELLKRLGCYYVQGYFYSKPIPLEEYVSKYCKEMEGGKVYYDGLYLKEAEARAQRDLREAELIKAQSATSAVQQFKKVYVERSPEEKEDPVKAGGKKSMLSTEEQKILASGGKDGK